MFTKTKLKISIFLKRITIKLSKKKFAKTQRFYIKIIEKIAEKSLSPLEEINLLKIENNITNNNIDVTKEN